METHRFPPTARRRAAHADHGVPRSIYGCLYRADPANAAYGHQRGKVMQLIQSLQRFIRDEEGASAVEYGLILSLLVLGLAAGATSLRTAINAALTAIGVDVGATI
jgi:Flp pilus assembly pilin Flp